MSKRVKRPVFFVCASILNGELITKTIQAASQNEASDLFVKQFNHYPNDILGPFFKKKIQAIRTNKVIKFSNETKKAIYGDWLVDAFFLTEPPDQAFLIFKKRLDGNKMPAPKGTITVPTSNLRFV